MPSCHKPDKKVINLGNLRTLNLLSSYQTMMRMMIIHNLKYCQINREIKFSRKSQDKTHIHSLLILIELVTSQNNKQMKR